jgi:hypothetical protein
MNCDEQGTGQQDPRREHGGTRPALWFGLIGGGVAWLGHLLSAYLIAEFGCISGLGERHALGLSVVAWLILVASVVALLVAGTAAFVAYRSRERLARESQATDIEPGTNPEYDMARTGWTTSALFVLIITVETIPIFFYLRNC